MMERAYWISRKRASLKAAESATGAQAKLVHYELAGRYSVKAAFEETMLVDLADSLPPAIHAAKPPKRDKPRARASPGHSKQA